MRYVLEDDKLTIQVPKEEIGDFRLWINDEWSRDVPLRQEMYDLMEELEPYSKELD